MLILRQPPLGSQIILLHGLSTGCLLTSCPRCQESPVGDFSPSCTLPSPSCSLLLHTSVTEMSSVHQEARGDPGWMPPFALMEEVSSSCT